MVEEKTLEEMLEMERTERIVKEIDKLGLSPEEAKRVIKNLKEINPKKYKPIKLSNSGKTETFGVISDLHMGHMNYRGDILRHAAKNFKKHGVDYIFNVGDTLEGMSGRDGHVYELDYIGASAQLDFFEEEMKVLKDWNVYSIEADSSHGGWFKSKGSMGLSIGEELQRRASNYIFLGYDEQDIELGNGLKVRMTHPGGGTAYAISYKMQKYIESLSGGKKPNIVLQGHFHKTNYMFYRNVHCFDSGCIQEQSPFMKKIRSPAHLGYWIIKATGSKKEGLTEIQPQFIPFYE